MSNNVIERHTHPAYPRLRIELRSDSRFYQAVSRIDGKLRQCSLKVKQLPTALAVAEDWYRRELRASVEFGLQHPIARLTHDPTMAELFASYRQTLPTDDKRTYAKAKWAPIAPFWRSRAVSSIKTQTFREFFTWRRSRNKRVDAVKNHTVHKDTVLVRQILKHAVEEDILEQLPVIPRIGKIEANPRPWLDPHEWRHLLHVSEQRIKEIVCNPRLKRQRQDLDDLIRFIYHSCARVGEIQKLRFSDCRIEVNKQGDKMLLAEVTGKRGTRTTVATAGAAEVYERRLKAAGNDLHALIFSEHPKDGFANLLTAAGLRKDKHGFVRNLKSLRSTGISARILAQPELNLTLIARNVGTSVAMIDAYYAKRLSAEMHKDVLSAIR